MSTAFIFTGQGSPAPSAGSPWTDTSSWALVDLLSEAARVDIGHLLLEADEKELIDTANAQLATFSLCSIIHHAVIEAGITADHVAGHSLGEFTALGASGVLSLADATAVVAARGKAMRQACQDHPGTMAAVLGPEPGPVVDACAAITAMGAAQGVWMANDNAPGQVVIAGTVSGVQFFTEAAQELGARKVMPLKVAGAFHTPLMASAQTDLDAALALAEWSSPSVTPWANVDASSHDDAGDWQALSSSQLCSPVRWSDQIAAMFAAGVDTFIEIGPGAVLSGMVKRIAPDATRQAVATPDAVATLAATVA